MKLYFVRHGETISNALNIVEKNSGSLSKHGKEQAILLAERFSRIRIDHIISSPSARVKQTAEIINAALKKPIEYSELLAEKKPPSEIIGKKFDDPEVVRITKMIEDKYLKENWRYSDEETFVDQKKRAQKFIQYIEMFSAKHILCVTHSAPLKAIMAIMLFGEDLAAKDLLSFRSFTETNNAGITICEKKEDGIWKLITWNDHTHLE